MKLSPRETEVAVLIVKELSNAEIAERMLIGEKTVKFHITNAFKKLGITTRYDLIAKPSVLEGSI